MTSQFYDDLGKSSFKIYTERKKSHSLSDDFIRSNSLSLNLPFIPEGLIHNIAARFLLNISKEDLSNYMHVFFMCQEAHWFYYDFCVRDYESKQVMVEALNTSKDISLNDDINEFNDNLEDLYTSLPKIGFKPFSFLILKVSGLLPYLLKIDQQDISNLREIDLYNMLINLIDHWKYLKSKIPVCGAIILDDTKQYVLMVKGYCNGKGHWGFPRGKIDEGEDEIVCASREVEEETGVDISKIIDKNLFISYKPFPKDPLRCDKYIKLFVVHGITKNTLLQPKARYEIKEIKWFYLEELYNLVNLTNEIDDTLQDINKDHKFFQVKFFVKMLMSFPLLQKSKFDFQSIYDSKPRDLTNVFFNDFKLTQISVQSFTFVNAQEPTLKANRVDRLTTEDLFETPLKRKHTSQPPNLINPENLFRQSLNHDTATAQININNVFSSENKSPDKPNRLFNFKLDYKPFIEILNT